MTSEEKPFSKQGLTRARAGALLTPLLTILLLLALINDQDLGGQGAPELNTEEEVAFYWESAPTRGAELESWVEAPVCGYGEYTSTYLAPEPHPTLSEILVYAIHTLKSIDGDLVEIGQSQVHRIPNMSDRRARILASQVALATQHSPNPLAYSLNALILAGYETGFTSLRGDCFIYEDIQTRSGRRQCNTEAERADTTNYKSCGMTQVFRNDHNPGYENRKYSCDELLQPVNALTAATDMLINIREPMGYWNISRYAGQSNAGERYEHRHSLVYGELLTRVIEEYPEAGIYMQ